MALILIGASAALFAARRDAVASRIGTEIESMPDGTMKRLATVAAGWLLPATAVSAQGQATAQAPLPPAPKTVIGMNVPAIQSYGSNAPFANLVIGSPWHDKNWAELGEPYIDRRGDLLSMPPGNTAIRYMLIPPTGPQGIDIRCRYQGSGKVTLDGGGENIVASRGAIRFHVVYRRGKPARPYLVVKDVDPRDPLRNLECREASAVPDSLFRPGFVDTVRGYGVLRFMDWQNANDNKAVRWQDRQPADGTMVNRDGAPIESMMALSREVGADPWFVMPWNADDVYIKGFADLVAATLPPDRHVYVEVGNEVWNTGFAVTKQAIAEGKARKLGADDREAGMRRYAQRTVEVMRIWEAAFAKRKGLVRVLATHNRDLATGQIALSYADTTRHVDALATAPYFGTTFGGRANTRESVIAGLSADIPAAIGAAVANRRLASSYGKRYIAYEGGEGLALPEQPELLQVMQHDPVQSELYRQYLTSWKREIGDVLCLLTSVAVPGTWGAWGLQAWEDETLDEAPKLKAVREFAPAGQAPITRRDVAESR